MEIQLLGKIILAALVGAGAALLVMVATRRISSFGRRADIVIDPLRIIEVIVVGISFLGAATILMSSSGWKKVEDEPETSNPERDSAELKVLNSTFNFH